MSRSAAVVAAAAAAAAAAVAWYLHRRRRQPGIQQARQRKLSFLRRAADGYQAIDSWRVAQLPGLLPPIEKRAAAGGAMVYLDYGGAALPHAAQLAAAARLAAAASTLANPHSSGPAAARAAAAMERARLLVLQHCCGERAHEWELVWTSGATAALRIAAEAFPFTRGRSALVHTQSAHTSVLGMRVPAAAAGASCHCVQAAALVRAATAHRAADVTRDSPYPVAAETRAAGAESMHEREGATEDDEEQTDHLMVLSGECNLTGDRLPLEPIASAFCAGSAAPPLPGVPASGRWWLMVDAAKLAASAPLDLGSSGAAMACVSLYKIFGEPTGLGALLVRSDLARRLRRDRGFYGGGSVGAVLAGDARYLVPKESIAAALAPGTPHFRGFLAVPAGFAAIEQLGGMERIERHTRILATELAHRLADLTHANGERAVILYGALGSTVRGGGVPAPEAAFALRSGPTLALNVTRHTGEIIGYAEVVKLAALHEPPIQLRGGCCCNPGGCQLALGLSDEDVRAAAASGKQCGDEIDEFGGRPLGVVRASLGKDSIWEDVDALVEFIRATFVAPASSAIPAGISPVEPSAAPQLREIFVYPIKSCAGTRCAAWWIDERSGRLLYDREWAIVDGCGSVMRLSSVPALATIRPRIDASASTLTLACAGMRKPLVLPLDGVAGPPSASGPGSDAAPSRRVNVCGKDCEAHEFGGAEASRWLSEALGVPCRLVRYSSVARYADDVAFANEAPILVVTQSAVAALNASLRSSGEPPVCAQHFRPNLVLDGLAPFNIDRLSHAHGLSGEAQSELDGSMIGFADSALRLRVTGPCARCAMVEIDPTSGARHGAVLRALARHHRIRSRLVFGFFCKLEGRECCNADPLIELREGEAVLAPAP